MDRRDFLKGSAMATAALMFDWEKAFAAGANAPAVGKVWKGWKPGHFQAHFIYTGVSESIFMIFPDGTLSVVANWLCRYCPPLTNMPENGSPGT